MTMATVPIVASVFCALRAWGRLNAGMALETASTPVRAVAPDENACRIANNPMGTTREVSNGSGVTCIPVEGQLEAMHFEMPTASMTKTERMNAYVGRAKIEPVSRTPRRLAMVSSTTQPIEISTVNPFHAGTNATMASTPATTDTATVRT